MKFGGQSSYQKLNDLDQSNKDKSNFDLWR